VFRLLVCGGNFEYLLDSPRWLSGSQVTKACLANFTSKDVEKYNALVTEHGVLSDEAGSY
jgi:hypothetical protein